MIAIFYLALQILKLYSYVVIANVIISWLVAFNVLNTSNKFVYIVLDFRDHNTKRAIDACVAGSQKLEKPMTIQEAKEFCKKKISAKDK